jgi:hypothetical protein
VVAAAAVAAAAATVAGPELVAGTVGAPGAGEGVPQGRVGEGVAGSVAVVAIRTGVVVLASVLSGTVTNVVKLFTAVIYKSS